MAAFSIHRSPGSVAKISGSTVVTVGNFDGLHLGHQELLKAVVARKKASGAARAAVVSFYPHPAVVLGQAREIPKISALPETVRILTEIGIDQLLLLHFTKDLAALDAATFCSRFFFESLGATEAVLGPDARIGKGREGTVQVIQEIFQKNGGRVSVVPFLEQQAEKLSSRGVRTLISEGDVRRAAQWLGRPFRIIGRVKRGAARGRTIGIPTANLGTGKQVTPKFGVYATRTLVSGREYPSVTNIGVRPTFGAASLAIESHLLDYSGPSFYGQRIEIAFIERLRDEKKFTGIDQLKAQIARDIELARGILC